MTTHTELNRDDILKSLRALEPSLRAKGVTGLAIFGSRSRGDARPDSDLDVLVEIDPDLDLSLLDLMGVQRVMRDAIGIETQAMLRSELNDRIAARISDDLIKVF